MALGDERIMSSVLYFTVYIIYETYEKKSEASRTFLNSIM